LSQNYAQAGSFNDYLIEKGRLSEDETRIIFGQLCLAVGYTHDKGVVHRDLKLENVLLDERCRVKLAILVSHVSTSGEPFSKRGVAQPGE